MHPHSKQPNPLLALIFLLGFGATLLVLLMLLSPAVQKPVKIEKLLDSNTLVVGLLEQRTSQLMPRRPISVQITEQLGAAYGWQIRYVRYSSFAAMTTALLAGEIDLVADMVIDHHPNQQLLFSHSHDKGQPVLVYFPQISANPVRLDALPPDSLLVLNNSWQEGYLARQQLVLPSLRWQELPDYFGLQGLVESLATPPGGYSLVLEREFAALAFANPQLTSRVNLDAVDLGFGLRPEDSGLEALLSSFISEWLDKQPIRPHQRPRALSRIGRVELHYFLQRMESSLPKYIDLMVEAGLAFDVDWRLIAAIAYQESHWNEDAISPTGVRGLMMLTRITAASVGVKDRTDPRQSLFGGTKYFLFLRDQIPKRISEPDRSWFALAAYNVGLAHIKDVRIYTQKQGGNPDRWEDVNANLHLLEDRNWYRNSKHGYARGREARIFVSNIRKYFEILLHLQPDTEKPQSPMASLAETGTGPSSLTLPGRIVARY